ncbi:pilus assembly protein PilP [Colwellia ponticola]|uniref:Pilus assembly protein PilP n=1 Tax=Colwellia ponticola TaxID=2304625 RepID=A0A8H2JK53_9GAMM|nr:pilus assembly protein PilP [Colwellia ponticola]TMM43937.1 pilus assembly protein PilP [Colwellia ponticola]
MIINRLILNVLPTKLSILSVVTLVFLSGCFDDTTEIKAYIAQVKATTTNYIEPMPEVNPFNHIDYSAGDLRSPFVLPRPEAIQRKMQQMAGCLSPDTNRRKQPLEKYALSDLTMRGTLGDENMLWALLEASDSSLHRVSKGNYLGLYNGRITQVSVKAVTIIELAPDGAGCWVERQATLNIAQSTESNK